MSINAVKEAYEVKSLLHLRPSVCLNTNVLLDPEKLELLGQLLVYVTNLIVLVDETPIGPLDQVKTTSCVNRHLAVHVWQQLNHA